MLKITRLIVLIIWITVAVLLLVQQFSSPPLIPSVFYLWILLGWVFFISSFGKSSKFSAVFAFSLFIVAAALTTVGFVKVAEIFMRGSFTLWIFVLVQSLIEYRRNLS